MIHRVENCFGLPLWKSKRRYVELWVCFNEVKPHSHPGQNVEIVPLFGWANFVRAEPIKNSQGLCVAALEQDVAISPRRWFRAFSIPAGWRHWFTLKRRPLIFLNLADTPQSAGLNFQTT